MGLTQKLGTIPLAILTDASNNVGIGAAPSGTYKLEVTGTAKVSSTLLVSGAATFSSSVQSIGVLSSGNNGATTGQLIIESGANAASRRWKLLTSQNVNGDFIIQQSTTQTGSTFADVLGFNATGAATFSSSVSLGSGDTSLLSLTGTSYGQITSPSTLYYDVDTQIFRNTAGTERLRITSDGNVGIGTSSPNYAGYPSGNSVLTLAPTSSERWGALELAGNRTSGGNQVGSISFTNINTSNTEVARIQVENGASSVSQGNIVFYTNGGTLTERMRITSGGNQFVYANTAASWVTEMYNDTSSTPYGIYLKYRNAAPNSTGSSFLRFDDSSANRLQVYSNGGLANYSGNNLNLASDIRLKKDITLLSSEWDKLKQIEVVNFKYKDSKDETALYGAIAQQIQNIYPELVVVTREATETEPEYYGLREQPFQWLTTKVLQEAMTKIEEQQAIITSLQDRLDKAGL